MTPERWQHIEKLYYAALERDATERAGFLDGACGGDEEVRREVESLLASHEQAGELLVSPAVEVAAKMVAKDHTASAVGRRVGHYRILSLLGAGGMGEVYLAEDTRLNRKVALKLLPDYFTKDQERVRRFEQEARAAGMLNHPNILTIYDIGTHDGAPYIVSELLEGETLRECLGTHASSVLLSQHKAVDYATQIARGLSAAHEKGIVHRDLKPENLFITSDGRVKILDFGLAKLKPPELTGQVDSQVSTEVQHTHPGVVLGTVAYMSPEQVRGEPVDHRSDIFSFGAILYEMLSGKRAFRRATMAETMTAILKEEPPELTETAREPPATAGRCGRREMISPQLERIVRRCLEKKPERRFQTASDLGFALETLSSPSAGSESSLVAKEAGWKPALPGGWREIIAWIVAAAFILATLGFAWEYFTRQPPGDERVMKTAILPPEKASFEHVAVSPDGRWLAFTAATGSKVQLWVRALDSTEAKALAGTEGAIYPFWSPDSRWIGFFASGKLKKVEVSGGLPATLCDAGVTTGGAWSREGVILFASVGGAGLSRVSATGGEVTPVMRPDLKRQETDYLDPCFLPDGRHFLYSKFSGQKEVRGIYLGSLDGGVNERLLGDDSNAVYAPSSRDGGYLLFGREGALMAQPFDADRRQLTGEPVPVARQVAAIFLGNMPSARRRNFSVSDTGVLVFDSLPNRQRSQLVWVDRRGRKTSSLDGLDNVGMLRLSPDDQRFIVTRFDFKTGGSDLWMSDATGGNVTRFTFDAANDSFPIWSPDGSRIVWASNQEGPVHLYQKAASGSGQEALLFKSDHYKFPADWSRDGRFIIYRELNPQTKYDVWVLPVGPLSGDQKPFPFLQTEANETATVLSPDGQWMAYSSDESGRYEVYVQSFPRGGSKRQVSTDGGIGPHWRGDGKELFYHASDGKLMAVAVKGGASFEASAPVPLFEFRAGGGVLAPYYAVTRDGQRFLLSMLGETEPNAPLTVVVNWTAEVKR
jgi:serine/threonine protein kinase/Tol biopolymer transport system component